MYKKTEESKAVRLKLKFKDRADEHAVLYATQIVLRFCMINELDFMGQELKVVQNMITSKEVIHDGE